jgi:hypothetical protein
MPSSTVYAALKIPTGLVARVFDPAERQENTPLGTMTVKYFKPRRKPDDSDEITVVIPGYASDWKRNAAVAEFYKISGPHDGEFMRTYMLQNKDSDIVRKHLLLIADDRASLEAMIKEHEKQSSGMGPLIPSTYDRSTGKVEYHDPRTRVIGAVTTADEQRNL